FSRDWSSDVCSSDLARPSMRNCLGADAEIVLDDGSAATIEEICKARSGRLATLDVDYRLARAEPSDFVDDGIKPTFEVVTRLGRSEERRVGNAVANE